MKKIALISANDYQDPYPIYPIGISYIATYLKEKMPAWQLDIFDFNLGGHADLALFLRQGNFDYIGVSLRNVDDTNYYEQYCFVDHYREVMQTIRKNSSAVV
ncbi:MAG: B12-binding domain-containing radical SAM protein, partial [Bacteroidales bacterium]|nr:B12-binding domain-containing radical SAM protein [Bacteroidales bacterium]MDD3101384.1 B12-binding domain-containing radical SAM protein [Bacteroidales bacterium]